MNRTLQIAGAVLFVLGLILLPISYSKDRETREAQDWAVVSGRVRESRIRGDSGGPFGFVEYEYEVGRKLYRSNRVSFESTRSTIDTTRYPESATVQVFYNPEKPNDAVLDRGRPSPLRKGGIIVMLLGAGLLLTPLVVEKMIRRQKKARQPGTRPTRRGR